MTPTTTAATNFPNEVRVKVTPPTRGVAVSIEFPMRRKNAFTYTIFTDATGHAMVCADELLRTFREDRNFFIMDYVDPQTNFAGHVSAHILGIFELNSAIAAHKMFKAHLRFPPGYLENLHAAAKFGQDLKRFSVEVETVL